MGDIQEAVVLEVVEEGWAGALVEELGALEGELVALEEGLVALEVLVALVVLVVLEDPVALVLTDLAVVPREKPHPGAAAREQPRDSPDIER